MTSTCSGPIPAPPGPSTHPLPPQNVNVISGYVPGVLDLRWDNPAILAGNSLFTVVGVNIYRSDTTDLGPYHRINDFPAGGSFYRDQTMVKAIQGENVNWNTGWVFKGDAPADRRWVFRTEFAMVKKDQQAPYQRPTYANVPTDIRVFIDGVEVPVDSVFGPTGEVTLINQSTYNVATEVMEPALLPGPDSVVQVYYYTMTNFVRSGLDTKLWYRLTTVVLDPTTPSGYFETDLGYCPPHSVIEVETLDYIWKEAIRRNHWILQQGGERVSFFIRRQSGCPCLCKIEPQTRDFSKQPSNRCELCYGVGIIGGFDGPFSCIIGPDDGEKRLSQTPTGRRMEHTYEVWTGPSPIVTQRDFIVKQTNERYSVGPVRRPSNRGNLLQQHFNIAYLDEGDIRYRVPMDGVVNYTYPQTRYSTVLAPSLPIDGRLPDTVYPWTDNPHYPVGSKRVEPLITEKGNTPDEKDQRGRSAVWENITWLSPLLLCLGHSLMPLISGGV